MRWGVVVRVSSHQKRLGMDGEQSIVVQFIYDQESSC
jgi:hypothetical protein